MQLSDIHCNPLTLQYSYICCVNQTVLKKLSLIAIIAVLAYSQVGYYFVLRYSQSVQKKSIKHKIRSQLKDADLEIISLTDNNENIVWLEEDKELLFKEEMYDVVRRKTVNGKTLLYCINDKKEKDLVEKYNLITKHNSSADKKGKHTVDHSVNLYLQQEESNSGLSFALLLNNYNSFDPHLPDNFMDKISPPPRG